ncbi:HNH endonuclease [Pseudomonas asplenii]|uniref:HNH endonuclease n=1 Tax=Pseudomonas asplenii TaxID=53407 RepID=UPI0037C745D7
MNLEDRVNYYENSYTLLNDFNLGKGSKIHLGLKGEECRFCGLSEPETTFNNESHAVPEFLGNHQLISNYECDTCNTFFSRNLEDHLDKYTKPYRTIAQIKGKTKIPSYKSRDSRARFDIKPNKPPAILARRDEPHISFDLENKTLTYLFQIEPHVPVAIYKCLVKIGLSIIDKKELENFSNSLRWINEQTHSRGHFTPLVLLKTFIPGPQPIKKLKIMIFKKNDLVSLRPHYFLLLGFGNLAYQIILPSDLDGILQKTQSKLVPIPLPFERGWPHGNLELELVHLNEIQVVKDMTTPITFSFDSMEPADEYVGKSLEELGYGRK